MKSPTADKPFTWRDGAYAESVDRSPERPAIADADDIGDFGTWTASSRKPKKSPSLAAEAGGVLSIARLVADKRASTDKDRFKEKAVALASTDTQTLVARIATTDDPLLVWTIHLVLQGRGVPPCLRWPTNDTTPQMHFLTWLGDILWFARRNPDHAPKFKAWSRLFKLSPGSKEWLEKAFWIFLPMPGSTSSLAHVCSKGLALKHAHRQLLMAIPTREMVAVRRALKPELFEVTREAIHGHAVAFSDKSGARTPAMVSRRRAGLWRVHLLCGESAAATADNWHLLTGEKVTRQAVAKQIGIVRGVLQVADLQPKNLSGCE